LILICGLILIFGIGSVHADNLNSIAREVTKAAKSKKIQRLTVLVFPYPDGNISSGTSLVSEQLASLLAKTAGLQIIEGSRISEVVHQIQQEQWLAAASSQTTRTNKDWGIDAIVTGTLNDAPHNKTMVHVRLIQVPSGAILADASAQIRRTWYDPPQPPPVPENPNAPYVMHASPLIFSPQGTGTASPGETTPTASAENTVAVPAAAPPTAGSVYGYAEASDVVVIDSGHNRKHEDLNSDRRPYDKARPDNSADSISSIPDIWSQCFYPALLTSQQPPHQRGNEKSAADDN